MLMVELCFFPQCFQPIQLAQGCYVRYVGADPKLQQDYANQSLRILAIDTISGITICENQAGLQLVGVSYRDLEGAEQP